MEQINLLDLNIDILNIVGDYVKKDNIDRMHCIQCKNGASKKQKI